MKEVILTYNFTPKINQKTVPPDKIMLNKYNSFAKTASFKNRKGIMVRKEQLLKN
ncbi:MAG: hypothetical protein GYA35_06885 [Thermoanaerobaculaceae bacterium]|nr:hypothetical protein [Thermoanaerobaculaceae bacterium]